MLGILLKMFTFLLVYFVSSTRCFFCVNFDKRNIFEIFHTFILLLQNYNQCVNIPKTVYEISTMEESIQIKKSIAYYAMDFAFAEGGGFEPPVRVSVRQFSKLLVSATHPTFLVSKRARLKSDTKLNYFCVKAKFFRDNTPFFTHLIGSERSSVNSKI